MTVQLGDSQFDLTGPLPTATTVLEASAGTGKTYAIVSLAVRYVVAGVPISKLLMATFSNAASAELRDRTRSRLAECLAGLDSDGPTDDPLIALLREGTAQTLIERRHRLTTALSDFDAATVATTHTFCNRMLGALGFLGDREQQYPLIEDIDDLVAELARDAYLARFAGDPSDAPTLDDAIDIAKAAVRNAATTLAPNRPDERTDASDLRVGLARYVRGQADIAKRRARVRTYDDLQSTLHRIITDPTIGATASQRIRDQFDVVLIDEFQDTDPQQWEIVRRCFHEKRPLILVGDPKQSIYAFRGAEVLSYLQAVQVSADRRLLSVNRRSDSALVDGLHVLFDGATFGHPEIEYHQVTAHHEGSRLSGGPALRIRAFTRNQFTVMNQDGTLPKVAQVREKVIADVAADIAALLSSDTTIEVDGITRPVQSGDIAVLLRANKTIEPLQAALADRGVASVVTSGTSVFATDAARHWWHLLTAIEQPSRQPWVRLAALTPLVGHTAGSLEAGGDAGIGTLAAEFAHLGRVVSESGFAAMSSQVFEQFDTASRILGSAGGERLFTDIRQVAGVCNRYAADAGAGLTAIVGWLGERISESAARSGRGDATRRLDRDTAAVQIMTVHASKGLEFPVVYVPFGWDGASNPKPATFIFHESGAERSLDVGGPEAAGYARRSAIARSESAGEDLRLLYVAATRARSLLVLWWAPSTATAQGALHRLIFTADERTRANALGMSAPIPDAVVIPAEDIDCVGVLRSLAARSPFIEVEPAGRYTGEERLRGVASAGDGIGELRAAVPRRRVDPAWRRTSYSAIIAPAHAAVHAASLAAAAESAPVDGADEPIDASDPTVGDGAPITGTSSPMNGLPFGASFGTLVHEVLEHVDTSAADRSAHVAQLVRDGARHRGVDIDEDVLATALSGVLTTPLGFGDLWSIKPPDRLAELDFELPLGAIDGGFSLAAVGELLAEHLPADDLLAPYAVKVTAISTDRYRGFLTGSIDSVLRTAAGQFVVVDYKTNRLRPGDLAVEDFSQEAMAEEMMSAHYPLQALLYSVALHRYLRIRLPGYRAEEHLGPVQYHFVRGMAGPATPPGCGVFQWALPASLVVAMSELLAGKPEARP